MYDSKIYVQLSQFHPILSIKQTVLIAPLAGFGKFKHKLRQHTLILSSHSDIPPMVTHSAQVVFNLTDVLYVSERWCYRRHVHVNECLCGSDIKLLVRPDYLPQEFMCAITITVCIPLSADAAAACDILSSTVANIQTRHPNAFRIIPGYFKSGQI